MLCPKSTVPKSEKLVFATSGRCLQTATRWSINYGCRHQRAHDLVYIKRPAGKVHENACISAVLKRYEYFLVVVQLVGLAVSM